MKIISQQRWQKGMHPEQQAVQYLQAQGYEIIAERYKKLGGEIDIIAYYPVETILAVVEVKARKSLAEALCAISFRQRRRIEQALLHFVAAQPQYAEATIRFDCILVAGCATPVHMRHVWQWGE